MRLWTLHPKYLDARGLVALWREALLAQAVLAGKTQGYVNHPQLIRFRETRSPEASIAAFLKGVHEEATRRGYDFDAARIERAPGSGFIEATEGQLEYEWAHLEKKLRARAPAWLAALPPVSRPDAHPLFRVVPGPPASWEIRKKT